MSKCRKIKLLFKVIPIKSIQYTLLQKHISKCDKCLNELADINEARSATIHKDSLKSVKDFYFPLESNIEKEERKKRTPMPPLWSWALRTAGALVLTIGLVFVITHSPQKENIEPSIKLIIDYVKLYEEPAQAIIFQTQEKSRTFIWVKKQNKGEIP